MSAFGWIDVVCFTLGAVVLFLVIANDYYLGE